LLFRRRPKFAVNRLPTKLHVLVIN